MFLVLGVALSKLVLAPGGAVRGDGACTSGVEDCHNCWQDCGKCRVGDTCSANSECASNMCCGTCVALYVCSPGTTSTSGCGVNEQKTCLPSGCGYGSCKCITGTTLACASNYQYKACNADGSWSACLNICVWKYAQVVNCGVTQEFAGCHVLYRRGNSPTLGLRSGDYAAG